MTEPDGRIITLSGSALPEIMCAVLQKGALFRFKAKGASMSPFIRDGDVLILRQADPGKIKTGDVAAMVNPANDRLVIHRVVERSGEMVTIKGDNLPETDGTFSRSGVIGTVVSIERRGKIISTGIGSVAPVIAFLSRTGLLNSTLLPILRKIRKTIT